MKLNRSEISLRLKDIARELMFLGQPRYPVEELLSLFPWHKSFIDLIQDQNVPFGIDFDTKKKEIDLAVMQIEQSEISKEEKLIFQKRLSDYEILLSMMEHFGTKKFYEGCLKLYGSSDDMISSTDFYTFLDSVDQNLNIDQSTSFYSGENSITYIKNKMLDTFPESEFEVKPSQSLLSDSSAGRKVLKLNIQKDYSQTQLDIFLVHEGWVHLGSSLNGALQPEHPWIGIWSPASTQLQEGLAILTEYITGHLTKERWNKILLRHLATTMAERGSSITEVYKYLRHQGQEDLDAFKLSLRVFRGVPLEGGMAFTKELLYLHGLVKILHFMNKYQSDLKSFWVGKFSFEEYLYLNKQDIPITYFPKNLEDHKVLQRLEELKKLEQNIMKSNYSLK